jgi:hypothetical protein
MSNELYTGQAEIVAGELSKRELIQQADRELLDATTDPAERQVLLRKIAGREGDLAHRRRFLAKLTGEPEEGTREKRVTIRLTEEEYARLQALAEDSGVLVGQYIRSKVL